MFVQLPWGRLRSVCRRLRFLMLGCRQDTFARRGMGAVEIRSERKCLGLASPEVCVCVSVCAGELVNGDSGRTSGVCCSSGLSRDCSTTGVLLVFQEKQRQNMLGVTSEQRSLFAAQQINQFQGKEGSGML